MQIAYWSCALENDIRRGYSIAYICRTMIVHISIFGSNLTFDLDIADPVWPFLLFGLC